MTVCSQTPTECWLATQDCNDEGIYVWDSRSLWAAGHCALERDGQELCGQGLILERLCPLYHCTTQEPIMGPWSSIPLSCHYILIRLRASLG